MKNILLALLLANILYFLWGMFVQEESQPGVAIVAESDLGPPLEDVTTGRDSDAFASVGAVLGSGEPSALEAVVGRSCVTIGPLKVSTEADSAVLEYSNEGMRTALRSTNARVFVGNWVQIRNIADKAQVREIFKTLRAGGLSDAYLMAPDDDELKISLGLFGDIVGAEKIELQAKSLDLPAEIIAETREQEVYFVDIGLPPGKGAGAMIEKYGEERVLLRDAATCPH